MDEPVSSQGIMKLRCVGHMWSHFIIELVYYNDWYMARYVLMNGQPKKNVLHHD